MTRGTMLRGPAGKFPVANFGLAGPKLDADRDTGAAEQVPQVPRPRDQF